MRLFAAIPLSRDVEERLLQFRLRTASPKDGLRWSQPEQWHITLRFFGDVENSMAAALQAALRGMSQADPELRVSALGCFPAKGILYAAVDPSPELLRLQAEVEQQASAAGLLPETRPFHPHITLARSKNRTGLHTLSRLAQPALPPLGPEMRWCAQDVVLYRSELERGGAVYEVLERFRMRKDEA